MFTVFIAAFVRGYKLLGREAPPKTIACLGVAHLSFAEALPPACMVGELGDVDPTRRLVILRQLTSEVHFPELLQIESAISEPSFAYELIISMVSTRLLKGA